MMTKQKARMRVEWARRQVGSTFAAEIGSFVVNQEADFPITFVKDGREHSPAGIRQSWIRKCNPGQRHLPPELRALLEDVERHFGRRPDSP
jgi:hypothetical protein